MVKKDNTGFKYDSTKVRWDLLPFDAINEIAKVMTYGSVKYEPRNWEKGMSWNRVFASLQRHLVSWFNGEDVDPESKMSHLAHAGCCILYLLAYEFRDDGMDDRQKLDFEKLKKLNDISNIQKYIDNKM